MTAQDLVVVRLDGGDASDATAAVAVDLTGCGWLFDRPSYEWSALVRPDRLAELLAQTGASQVGEPGSWDGSPFGDGNGGIVEWRDGVVVGDALNAAGLRGG